jgi:hypothetical protein
MTVSGVRQIKPGYPRGTRAKKRLGTAVVECRPCSSCRAFETTIESQPVEANFPLCFLSVAPGSVPSTEGFKLKAVDAIFPLCFLSVPPGSVPSTEGFQLEVSRSKLSTMLSISGAW